jgi:hypothetical protein
VEPASLIVFPMTIATLFGISAMLITATKLYALDMNGAMFKSRDIRPADMQTLASQNQVELVRLFDDTPGCTLQG